MSFNFLNPNLLWLLALALVPLLLHLFARTKPPVYEFSSVEFLRKIIRKTMRLKKPQDYLLLALRTLAVLALIGAFLRPLLFSQEKLSGLFQKKSLVAIVDASASMAYVEGAQTRFATACAETSELLSGLSARDQANIIWMKAEPESVFPDELASNLGYLKDQLRRASVTVERGSLDKSFALALELLAEAEGKKEICIVSDFQATAWEDFSPAVPEGVDLIHVRIGKREAGNRAIVDLSFEPSRPVVGEEIAVYAEIQNFSSEDVETTVFSEVGENRRSQNLSLPAGQRITTTFRHTVSSAGPTPIRISLTEDAFPADDQRMAVAEVRPYLRLAMIGEHDPDTARIWTRAAQALQWAVPEWVSPADLTTESVNGFDAVFWSGTPSEEALALFAAAGETLKFVLQPAPGDLPPSLFPDSTDSISVAKESSGDELYSISIADPDAELFELFRGDDHGDLDGLSGKDRLRLSNVPGGKSLLQFSDGSPALLEATPRRYLWLLPLSGEPGNFAGRVEFLPFFAEFLLSNRLTGVGVNQYIYEPGDPVLWEAPEPIGRDDLRLLGPDKEELEFQAAEGQQWMAQPFDRPGIFPWQLGDNPIGYSVVNFPPTESNLASLTREQTQDSASVAVEGGSEVRQLRDGIPLWPWLLAAAVCFFLLESGVTFWAARTP
ncbi:MAG: BatA domain-containing protein [Verrucomicrobiales bacterium]|nr:BatA domain-containing protein [Verrucomicrobiales bacterium]